MRGGAIRRRLAAALETLPSEFREAVVLRDVEGLDYRSIGRTLGVRVGTVKSRIARGREMLREQLVDLLP
jgi:RNA polymerase sigma-70 factor (ECF subfamily)